eukprot:1158269-Pelagomonas_calceolata.AAC.12
MTHNVTTMLVLSIGEAEVAKTQIFSIQVDNISFSLAIGSSEPTSYSLSSSLAVVRPKRIHRPSSAARGGKEGKQS